MRSLVVALAVLVPSTAIAGPKLTLDQTIQKALAGPKAKMARGDADAAAARIDEASAARLPRLKATAFGTISPKITCIDPPQCTQTSPQNFAFDFEGLYGGGQIDLTQPLFTFGKLTHARNAARAGLDAQRALGDETAGDLAVDAARAYWGVKLAREIGFMLDDGIEEIDKAIAKMNATTGANAPTIQDKQRVAVLLAEAKVQRADAAAGERQALAGLRALTGIPDADVDDAPLEIVKFTLPATATGEGRPQARAAKHGAVAADELAGFAAAYYWPDFAVVGSLFAAKAQGVDDPRTVFANDPFNRTGGALALALQWTIEPWTVRARVARARAEASKAHALSDLASSGARYDAEVALAEATSAKTKLDAATEGEKAGHAWVVAVLQNNALGTVEPKDFADAYLGWFTMRGRLVQATFQWNVAVVRLGRAGGEFRASGYRP